MASCSSLSFNDLPSEILEIIFSNLTLCDLFLSAAAVNSTWRALICNPSFCPWKKFYYLYKSKKTGKPFRSVTSCPFADDTKASETIKEDLLTSDRVNSEQSYVPRIQIKYNYKGVLNLDNALPWALNYICKHFDPRSKGNFAKIRRHRKYQMSVSAIEERFPEFMGNFEGGKRPKDVAVIFVLCAIADDVWDVREVISSLLRPGFNPVPKKVASNCEVTELLYAIATVFLFLNRKVDVPNRFHFNLFQALYYFENDWSYDASRKDSPVKPKKGQMSLLNFGFKSQNKTFTSTAEQQRIINHPLSKGSKDIVKIIAFAGTGKTTTLVRLCKKHPELKFMVVMYNKCAQTMASDVFPKENVYCTTIHAMAMRKCGFLFSHKMTNNLTAKDILDSGLMACDQAAEGASDAKKRKENPETRLSSHFNRHQRSAQVLKTLENFMNSPDPELTEEHVPERWGSHELQGEFPILGNERLSITKDAVEIWGSMADKNDDRIRIGHDGYLKVWQLRNPDLQNVREHDVLLVDEGQDLNPTMYSLFLNQNVPKFIVGDPNQQIYLFRGTINALDLIKQTQTYYLTQSFRFGPEIAFAANCSLHTTKRKDQRTLVGGKKFDKLVPPQMMQKTSKEFPQIAIIGRSNLTLIQTAIDKLCHPGLNVSGEFAGGIDALNLDSYVDIFYLYVNQKDRMKTYKNFKSFDALESFATNTNDNELLIRISMAKKFPHSLPSLIGKLKDKCKVKKGKKADFVFTTAHKAKGLEWDNVFVLDDFAVGIGNMLNIVERKKEEETNLLYVAMTRAKKHLAFSYAVRTHLANSYHLLDKIIPGPTILDVHECVECKKTVSSRNALHLRSVEGDLCSSCSSAYFRNIPIKETAFITNYHYEVTVFERNRTFLRYLCGPTPADKEEALQIYAERFPRTVVPEVVLD